ncbi:MAG: PH domain-containing protein [Verrucomicrobiaceae bacterium]|nr:PH domain-containing protein [Verrucomicrobiaceae bacterium]
MSARFRIQNNPTFEMLLSREDLYLLVERGSVARGDFCFDVRTGSSHKVGELIDGMHPPRSGGSNTRIDRPYYRELRADGPASDDQEPETSGSEPSLDDMDESGYTASGERIHYHGHPSWWAFTKPFTLFFLLGIASGLGFQFGWRYFLSGAGLACLTLACTAVARFSRDYYVTNERVEVVWGVIGRSSKEVRICDIRAIDVHEAWLTGLLGVGSLDFSSAGTAGVEVQFKDIRNAHEVKEIVRELQRAVADE